MALDEDLLCVGKDFSTVKETMAFLQKNPPELLSRIPGSTARERDNECGATVPTAISSQVY